MISNVDEEVDVDDEEEDDEEEEVVGKGEFAEADKGIEGAQGHSTPPSGRVFSSIADEGAEEDMVGGNMARKNGTP